MNIIALDYSPQINERFAGFRHDDFAVLLESAGENQASQFSFFSSKPSSIISLSAQQAAEQALSNVSLKQKLNHLLDEQSTISELPFCGGWIGYANYEFNHRKPTPEKYPKLTTDTESEALFWAGFYEWAVIYDHHKQSAILVYLDSLKPRELTRIKDTLNQAQSTRSQDFTCSAFKKLTSQAEYCAAFEKIQQYLLAGDCYQINYAQAYQAKYKGDTYQAYQQLSAAVPSPFMAYFSSAQQDILSISPERLLSVKHQQMRSSPIKGTEKRSDNTQQDQILAAGLVQSSKNRAENLMIVDLIRNDLSKHAKLGTVNVPELFNIESFSNVHHLVSHIDAELKDSSSAFDVFFDAFPGGSITGAPKIRAMQIIQELEQKQRGIYCGSIFYASTNQRFDSNIAIRTLSCSKANNTITAWAGGGIVKDSQLNEEYQECDNKIQKLLQAISPKSC